MQRRLLLLSSSRVHGSGYLEYCADQLRGFLGGPCKVLFVPYALKDHDGYAATAAEAFKKIDCGLESVHRSSDPASAAAEAEAVFVGGGNTFRLLDTLYRTGLLVALRERAGKGTPYMGASAGSNVACLNIKTTNDMPIVQPPSFEALALVPFNLNPHYVDPDPSSTHMGETRETRIREFHEENDAPVLGLREGGLLRVEGDAMTLLGGRGARLFRRAEDPRELEPGADLSFLLS